FFCPGCGHGLIVDYLNEALVRLQLDPRQVVIVTDIGCSGLADKYFVTNAFHGLHGRSITYATGIKLGNPDLKVIVLIGDGGCGIGGHHLINAARRNIGLTVMVFNNLNYGMTGGEHSVSTPTGGITCTTPNGQLERPMDLCKTVAVNGAGLAARLTAFDSSLPDLLVQAIQTEAFSLIDVWELCTAYYVPNNKFSKKALTDTMAGLGFETGIVHQESRPEFSRAYRTSVEAQAGKPAAAPHFLQPTYASNLDHELSLVVAGAAGKKINTAASTFCRGALLSGLYAAQRNDYPVTVKSGHSISEVILSHEKITYTGISQPEVMIILFNEGLASVKNRLAGLSPGDRVYVHSGLLPLETPASIIPIDFKRCGAWGDKKEYWGIMALALVLENLNLFPLDALKAAIALQPAYAEETLFAINAIHDFI
ncbi:MAG: 2-oxoglutarate synthase, partial [Chloroflexota bacterium]